jgi:hypothetical protein
MLSVDTAADVAGPVVEAFEVGTADDSEPAGVTPAAGSGGVATSPLLTPERGASATQAVTAASARAASNGVRTEGM